MKSQRRGGCAVVVAALLIVFTAIPSGAQKVAYGRASNVGDQAWVATGDWTTADPMQTTGMIRISVMDATPTDAADSKDAANIMARFKYPTDGPEYTVKFTSVISRGSQSNYYGGVAMMRWLTGPGNIVGMSVPTMFAYIGAAGRATITKNGETVATNQPAYVAVTQGIHDDRHRVAAIPDPTHQEVHLFVPGSMQTGQPAVPGFPDGGFYIYWPGAAFEVANVGGSVTMSGMDGITLPVAPTDRESPAGSGPLQATIMPSKLMGRIEISLTDTAIRKKLATGASGLYDVRVTNNSSEIQGIVYRGTDICCTEYIRFSTLMKPGESQTFRWYFAPGKVTMRNYLDARKTGTSFADVAYGRLSSSIVFR